MFSILSFIFVYIKIMARIIGIDYGLRRVGLAVTDRGGIMPFPLKTVSPDELLPFLQDYIVREDVEKIILGFPADVDQNEEIVLAIKKLHEELAKAFAGIPIIFIDERYTSKLASSYAYKFLSKKERRDKGVIDMLSAALILQSYINERDSKRI